MTRFSRWQVGALLGALMVVCSAAPPSTAHAGFEIFIVTTTADTDGSTCATTCSLRQAINASNANPDLDLINFAIAPGGFQSIAVGAGGLPPITDRVIIDGATQPGFAGTPLIELNGAAAGTVNGLTLAANDIGIQSLIINRFGASGIEVNGSFDYILGSYIGTNAAGSAPGPGNGFDGVRVFGGSLNRIGAPSEDGRARNVISGNAGSGVLIWGVAAAHNYVEANYIGTDRTGEAAVGNTGNGVWLLDAPINFVGSAEGRNVISANGHHGIDIGGTTANGNRVEGNYIGTDKDGMADLGNAVDGIQIFEASDNAVGGLDPNTRNVIAGNGGDGIQIQRPGAARNVVRGNVIGLGADGPTDIGNANFGVSLLDGAHHNTVGLRNVISGNRTGVRIEHANTVSNSVTGNLIGTDASGLIDRGNDEHGVLITTGAADNTIGDAVDSARNIIAGNGANGIRVDAGATRNAIKGNYIGVNATGARALANGMDGVLLTAPNNVVGGLGPNEGNVIGGNSFSGVSLFGGTSNGNRVQGNLIGVARDGTTSIANGGSGVSVVQGAHDNAIGGRETGAGNTIATNRHLGVFINALAGIGNTVLGNAIYGNVELGIDLQPTSSATGLVTPNDAGDADGGPNGTQNFPVLTAATRSPAAIGVSGTLDSRPNTTFSVELFGNQNCDPSGYGEGQTRLGMTAVVTNNSGTVSFSVPLALTSLRYITATATGPTDGTSEFSACVTVADPRPPTSGTRTITFDDPTPAQTTVSGEYPSGVIVWEKNGWVKSPPWGKFTTKSVSFNGNKSPSPTQASFSFVVPRRLVSVDAYNGGTSATTVTLTCAGQPDRQMTLGPGQLVTINTNWSGRCANVTIASSNGWHTNFDNLVVEDRVLSANETLVTFDDRPGQNQPLTGAYPAGLLDWGADRWLLSSPFGTFSTKNVGFNGRGITEAQITIVRPARLVSVQAHNGGNTPSTVTLRCADQPAKQVTLAPRQTLTIETTWTESCATVYVSSSNGWDTNFDNLLLEGA
jgi:CSLREA domain-containing protein